MVVPCVLAHNMAMECEPQKTQSWSVYEWSPQSDKLQPQYKMLPYAVFAAPISDNFAWVVNNKLCVGKPNEEGVACVEPKHVEKR